MKERLQFITTASAIGIISVVLGHSHYGGPFDIDHYSHQYSFNIFLVLLKLVTSYHMHLFMFISGYVLGYSENGKPSSLFAYISKRFRRLIVPYILISTMAFPIKVLLSRYAIRPTEFSPTAYIKALIYPWDNTIIFFWFLPTVFIIGIILHTINSIIHHYASPPKRQAALITLTLGLAALSIINPFEQVNLFNFGGVFYYLLYASLGYFCYRSGICEMAYYKKPIYHLAVLGLFVFLVFYNPEFPLKRQLRPICGIDLCIYASFRIPYTWLLDLIGRRSYQIFLLMWFPQIYFKLLIAHIYASNNFLLLACSMFFSGIIIPLFVSMLVKTRIQILSPLVGLR